MRQGSFLGGVKVSEAEVQKAIMQFLRYKNVFFHRSNSGAFTDAKTNRFIRYGAVGLADISAIYPGDASGRGRGLAWYIEVKRPGGRLSDGQIQFLAEAKRSGAVITIAESVEDVAKVVSSVDAPIAERYARALGLG